MSLTITKPFAGNIFSAQYPFLNQTYAESLEDTNSDVRSPLKVTPRGSWRPPTSYARYTDTGSVDTYNAAGTDRWGDGIGVGFATNTWSGARNSSGFWRKDPPIFPSELEDKAITRALLKLKNEKVNLAQAFAERGQTVRLVGDNISRLTEFVLDFRRRRRKLLSGELFQEFLAVQYGWRPFLQDSYGAVKALHEKEQEAGRGRVTVKASVKEHEMIDEWLSDSANTTIWDFIRRSRVEFKGAIRLDFVQSNGAPIGPFTQLGLTNPAVIAWELTPWSFVADWFIPIGDYLSLLDATLGWDFLGGSFSQKVTLDYHPVNASVRYDPNKPYDRDTYCNVSGSGRRMRFNRKVYSVPPFPNRPHLKTGRSGQHVANGIALLMAAITGHRGAR